MSNKSRGSVATPNIAKRMTYGVLWFGCCACTIRLLGPMAAKPQHIDADQEVVIRAE